VLRHCYCPLRIHTPYMTPNEARSMRALAALRMGLGVGGLDGGGEMLASVSRLPPVSYR